MVKFKCVLKNGIIFRAKDETGLMTMAHVVKILRDFVWMFEEKKGMNWQNNCGHYTASYKEGRRVLSRIYLNAPDNTYTNDQYLDAIRPVLAVALEFAGASPDFSAFQAVMRDKAKAGR